jgi:hypothetical protein
MTALAFHLVSEQLLQHMLADNVLGARILNLESGLASLIQRLRETQTRDTE